MRLGRAAGFTHVPKALPGTGNRYMASLNTENYQAMLDPLSSERANDLHTATVLTLRGDRPENKLLGLQFGK